MPACINGARPAPGFETAAAVLDAARLPPQLTDILGQALHLPLVSYYLGVVDIPDICRENKDPPEALTQNLISHWSDYVFGSGPARANSALEYIRDYLRYQVFLTSCVCNAPTLNPELNCLHATNVSLPQPVGSITNLGTVTLEPAVRNSWDLLNPPPMRVFFNSNQVITSGPNSTHDWDLELQFPNGQWLAFISNTAIPTGAAVSTSFAFNSSAGVLGTVAPLRIRNVGGRAYQLAQLNCCFEPYVAPAPGLPTQPALPGLPTVPPPVCDTTDLCSIVLDLARSLSRVAGQVSDIQAQLVGTNALEITGQEVIFGEGERTLAVGTHAVNIQITSMGPGVFTSALGRPRGLMRAGSIRWGDGQGYSERTFIDAEDFTRIRPQGALTISWQLINDCVAILHYLA